MRHLPISNARVEAVSESWFMFVGYGMAVGMGAGVGAIVGALFWPEATLGLAVAAGGLGAGLMRHLIWR